MGPLFFLEDFDISLIKKNIKKKEKLFFLIEETVFHLFEKSFEGLDDFILFKGGEDAKNIESLSALLKCMMTSHLNRESQLVLIGGGAFLDLASFACSLYHRGINFYTVPTTLLSMVDVCVGGKNGINFGGVKNQIGTFTSSKGVFVIPSFLKTLNEFQMRDGMVELLKHFMICDKEQMLLKYDEFNMDLLKQSIQIKKEIVEKDFHEKGLRRILNIGHTIAHGLEAYFSKKGRPLSHGEAVLIGLVIETLIAEEKDIAKKGTAGEINEIFKKFHLRPPILSSFDFVSSLEFKNFLLLDKKNKDAHVIFMSFLQEIGKAAKGEDALSYRYPVTIDEIERAFQSYQLFLA